MALVLVGATIPLTVVEVGSMMMVLGIHIEFVTVLSAGRLLTSSVEPAVVVVVGGRTVGRLVVPGGGVVLLPGAVLFVRGGRGLRVDEGGVVVVEIVDGGSGVGTLVLVDVGRLVGTLVGGCAVGEVVEFETGV